MGSKIPPNLSITTTYLTDTPYEVQLGVLRGIRTLLAGVVDDAISQASTKLGDSAHNHQQQQQQGQKQQSDGDGLSDESLVRVDMPKENDSDVHLGSDPPVGSEIHAEEGSGAEAVAPSAGEVEGLEESGTAALDPTRNSSSRKRPRTPSPTRRDFYTAGSVVECFHPVSLLSW